MCVTVDGGKAEVRILLLPFRSGSHNGCMMHSLIWHFHLLSLQTFSAKKPSSMCLVPEVKVNVCLLAPSHAGGLVLSGVSQAVLLQCQ